MKNTLAIVQSIATHALRNALTLEEARSGIESRLMALARVHDVLSRERWEAADLREIVAQAIEPYALYGSSRIEAEGPTVRVPARVALALAMTLQELATNAVKYGALSNDAGEVRIGWELDDGGRELRFSWQEMGGPHVQEPARRGFGTRLIWASLTRDVGGNVQMDFAERGLRCAFQVPL